MIVPALLPLVFRHPGGGDSTTWPRSFWAEFWWEQL